MNAYVPAAGFLLQRPVKRKTRKSLFLRAIEQMQRNVRRRKVAP